MENQNVFESLFTLNVNEHVEKKNTGKTTLSYLSWSWAWAEVKKRYPTASYEVKMFDNLPYSYDSKTGYMVYTTVTIEGITHMMWLPVMDSHNEAMLDHSRTVKTKYSEYTVDACTMFDVNKTIMRCLTKNLAMFGLGLYIYSGEDLPSEPEMSPEAKKEREKEIDSLINSVIDYINNGTLTGSFQEKADFYIKNRDFTGLNQCISYCKSQVKKGA